MTLVSIKNDLVKARAGQYAVPLFNVYEGQGVEGVMAALAACRAPTILGVYSPFADMPYSRAFAEYIRCRASDTDVPISLMLDHGASVEICLKALQLGFTDVMYDGSRLPVEENIANTRKVVQAAHAVGAAVEAELGHVGSGETYATEGGLGIGFTDPAMVEYFVEQTGIDFLAIAFGNAHGLYKGEPKLDLELVSEIRRRVDVPLVMHGGTGISDEQFLGAVAAGISKVNYATNILNTASRNICLAAEQPDSTFFTYFQCVREAYAEWAAHLYGVFGTQNRAA